MNRLIFGVSETARFFGLQSIDLEPHSSTRSSLVARGKVPHVAWSASSHNDYGDTLTVLVLKEAQTTLFSLKQKHSIPKPIQNNTE